MQAPLELESTDFELEGVVAVGEDGTHSKTPEPVKKGYELGQFGIHWYKVAKVPVPENGEVRTELDPKMLETQLRMTKCAYDSLGKDPAFIISRMNGKNCHPPCEATCCS
jgi:hypothetical protein